MYLQFKILFFIIIAILLPIAGSFVFASTTDGTVTGVAWSNNIGWINFGITTGDIHVTDTVLTGEAWNKYFGWIKLDPTNGGVTNDAEGNLSGTAWGSNIGWIDFSGVIINSSGLFTGTANGTNAGIINFSCANCNVTTDWRPESIRTEPFCGDGLCNGSEGCGTCPGDCGTCGGGGDSHNECNLQNQCVSVSGPGNNLCTTHQECQECDTHGDLNKDTKVNLQDFSILMYYWLQTEPENPCADINKDGIVDLKDFSIMLYWWS